MEFYSNNNNRSHSNFNTSMVDPTNYLESRGITKIPIEYFYDNEEEIQGTRNPFYGYLCFVSEDGKKVVGRYLAGKPNKENPRYRNEKGSKDLFYIHKNSSSLLWLAEGIIDGLSLYELDIKNIASTNSTSGWAHEKSDEICYSLRGTTVVIIFDADSKGYLGAKKVAEELKQYEVDYAIVELPRSLGEDINDALQKKPKELKLWVEAINQRLDPDDRKYTTALFTGNVQPLMTIETGIKKMDSVLDGGFKDGAHVIAGSPGSGKTAISLGIAVHNIELFDRTAIVNSCELSKRQMWCRTASIKDPKVWSTLEKHPERATTKTKQWCKELAENLRIVVGWPINRIVQEAKHYDIIIIDYIQRVSGAYSGDESQSRALIDANIANLSDLGRDLGKVVIVVSSLARYGYNDPDSFAFKGSGNIEYVGTTASKLIPIAGDKIVWNLQKDTRGGLCGKYSFRPDLGHCLPEKR